MNAILSHVSGQDHIQRNEAIKRRNAEEAFSRHMKYNGDNQKTLSQLEALITGKQDVVEVQTQSKKVGLGAGQVKQIEIPVGKTLEETIDIWRNVRSEAISVPEPSTADHQLAAKASAKIRQTETKMGIEQKVESTIDSVQALKTEPGVIPAALNQATFEVQRRYERAISSYSFHIQAKENGYEIARPSFFKVA